MVCADANIDFWCIIAIVWDQSVMTSQILSRAVLIQGVSPTMECLVQSRRQPVLSKYTVATYELVTAETCMSKSCDTHPVSYFITLLIN